MTAGRGVSNRDGSAARAAPTVERRARWDAQPMTGAVGYPTLRASVRATPGSCLHGFTEKSWDRDALFATTAALAGTSDRCVLAAEAYVAELALALDREGPGCKGNYVMIVRAWSVAARLASTQARRRIALRNRAEAMWRDQDWEGTWSLATGVAVARAFRDAVAAGDRAAIGGEVDAWIRALASSRRDPRRELAQAIANARARHRGLVEPALARRLHAAIDDATERLANVPR